MMLAMEGKSGMSEIIKAQLTDEVATLLVIMQKRKIWLVDYLFSVVGNLKEKKKKKTVQAFQIVIASNGDIADKKFKWWRGEGRGEKMNIFFQPTWVLKTSL